MSLTQKAVFTIRTLAPSIWLVPQDEARGYLENAAYNNTKSAILKLKNLVVVVYIDYEYMPNRYAGSYFLSIRKGYAIIRMRENRRITVQHFY